MTRVAEEPATYPCRFFFKRNKGVRLNGDDVKFFQHASSGQYGTIKTNDKGSFVSLKSVSKRFTKRPMNAESKGGLA